MGTLLFSRLLVRCDLVCVVHLTVHLNVLSLQIRSVYHSGERIYWSSTILRLHSLPLPYPATLRRRSVLAAGGERGCHQ